MSIHLLVHNVIFLLGGAMNIGLICLVLYVRRRNLDILVTTFLLMMVSVTIFQVSHVFGVMAPDAEVSRKILMFNISIIPINAFMAHWFLVLVEKNEKRRISLILIYATGAILFLIHAFYPSSYLLPSVPKLYFPFYYNPGPLQIVTRLWFVIVGLYYFTELAIAYRQTDDPVKRNRYKYVFLAIIWGFIVGQTAILLIYNIPFDPALSAFFGLYTIPITYAVVRYELLDIKILAKRAFLYATAITIVGIILIGINISNDYLSQVIVGYPRIIGYILTAVIIGGSGVFVWLKAQEADLLKYEFVTIITHKFRTPMTHIKWSTESLMHTKLDSAQTDDILNIQNSNIKLVELTDMLVALTDTESSDYSYRFKKVSLNNMIKGVLDSYIPYFKKRGVELAFNIQDETFNAMIDDSKVVLALQILFDNALIYTPVGGKVFVALARRGDSAIFSVTDSGIGIKQSDLPYVFKKFYRSGGARLMSTEGMGIGLYMAKNIITRNGGAIAVQSEGEGKGATFSISFPVSN